MPSVISMKRHCITCNILIDDLIAGCYRKCCYVLYEPFFHLFFSLSKIKITWKTFCPSKINELLANQLLPNELQQQKKRITCDITRIQFCNSRQTAIWP